MPLEITQNKLAVLGELLILLSKGKPGFFLSTKKILKTQWYLTSSIFKKWNSNETEKL